MVASRLAGVSSRTRDVIEAASILGQDFSGGQLRLMVSDDSACDLSAFLGEACKVGILEGVPGSMEKYQFVHALIRESILSLMGQRDQVNLHARAVHILQQVCAGEETAYSTRLLSHAAAARQVLGKGPVVRYALLAGERALSARAYDEALRYFETGISAREGEPLDDQAAALLFGLARTHAMISMGHVALPFFVRCLQYYERTGNAREARRGAHVRVHARRACAHPVLPERA